MFLDVSRHSSKDDLWLLIDGKVPPKYGACPMTCASCVIASSLSHHCVTITSLLQYELHHIIIRSIQHLQYTLWLQSPQRFPCLKRKQFVIWIHIHLYICIYIYIECDIVHLARPSFPWQVYDVTSFLSLHPGGGQLVVDAAAQDSTSLFERTHGEGLRCRSVVFFVQTDGPWQKYGYVTCYEVLVFMVTYIHWCSYHIHMVLYLYYMIYMILVCLGLLYIFYLWYSFMFVYIHVSWCNATHVATAAGVATLMLVIRDILWCFWRYSLRLLNQFFIGVCENPGEAQVMEVDGSSCHQFTKKSWATPKLPKGPLRMWRSSVRFVYPGKTCRGGAPLQHYFKTFWLWLKFLLHRHQKLEATAGCTHTHTHLSFSRWWISTHISTRARKHSTRHDDLRYSNQ